MAEGDPTVSLCARGDIDVTSSEFDQGQFYMKCMNIHLVAYQQ